METALALYRAGELQAALQHLREQLQERPGDAKVRTFLFELLCFAGEWTRAEKQLDVLAAPSPLAASGASLLRGLLNVHRKREQMFEEHSVPVGSSGSSQGFRINGAFCDLCADEDDRIGGGLEIYSAGGYQVLAWSEIRHLAMAAPVTLRDLLWIPANCSA